MAQAICNECSFKLDLPPQVQLARVACPRCRGSLSPAPAAPTPVTTMTPAPISTRSNAAPTRNPAKQRDNVRVESSRPTRTQPRKTARDAEADEPGMGLGLKIALIAVPCVAVIAAILFIALNRTGTPTEKDPGPDGAPPIAFVDRPGGVGPGPGGGPIPAGGFDKGFRPIDAGGQQQVQFLGAQGEGRRFVIIADRSGSMNAMVRPADGTPPRQSIVYLQDELIRTLRDLKLGSSFYVSFFGSSIIPMPRGDTWAEGGRDLGEFENWIRTIRPSGGTNPLPAFIKAFSLDPAPDVIFFMTDGGFPDATATIAGMNARLPKKIPIHTIHFDNAPVRVGPGPGPGFGNRYAKIMDTFELPGPVQTVFAMHAGRPGFGGPKVGGLPARRFQQLEDIAAGSGGTFRVFGGEAKKDEVPLKIGGRIAPILAVNGDLTNFDLHCPHRAGHHAKAYDVVLQAGMTYQIDMVGNMDPYLCLQDATGRLVASNDDGGGSLNSLITFRPMVTGNYRIFATTCGSGRTGTFALTVIDRPLF